MPKPSGMGMWRSSMWGCFSRSSTRSGDESADEQPSRGGSIPAGRPGPPLYTVAFATGLCCIVQRSGASSPGPRAWGLDPPL